MKLLEELSGGDVFLYNNNIFILTIDYKQRQNIQLKNCISLKDGSSRWIESSILVENVPIFTTQTDGTIIPIKETKKTDELGN
jgi:hypothetical protein